MQIEEVNDKTKVCFWVIENIVSLKQSAYRNGFEGKTVNSTSEIGSSQQNC